MIQLKIHSLTEIVASRRICIDHNYIASRVIFRPDKYQLFWLISTHTHLENIEKMIRQIRWYCILFDNISLKKEQQQQQTETKQEYVKSRNNINNS